MGLIKIRMGLFEIEVKMGLFEISIYMFLWLITFLLAFFFRIAIHVYGEALIAYSNGRPFPPNDRPIPHQAVQLIPPIVRPNPLPEPSKNVRRKNRIDK